MLKLKLHNIYHDEINSKQRKEVRKKMDEYINIMKNDIKECRIAWGRGNSPIILTIDRNRLSLKRAKKISSRVIREFSKLMDVEIDKDKVIDDCNIIIMEN